MRISDWSSDVCSSDLSLTDFLILQHVNAFIINAKVIQNSDGAAGKATLRKQRRSLHEQHNVGRFYNLSDTPLDIAHKHSNSRSEEHTSELQSLMRISYAVFCLKKKNICNTMTHKT